MSEKRCLVAICHNGPVVTTETAQSLMELGWGSRVQSAKDAHGFAAIDFAWEGSFPRVDAMRDYVVWKALEHPSGYTHILFLDADMVWPTDVLVRMLRHHDRNGIVSGLYHLKTGSHPPVAMLNSFVPEGQKTVHYEYDVDYRTGSEDVREVQLVGMGCTLIPLSIFRAMPRPWFEYELDDEGWPRVSEDVPFCRKVRELGFQVWFDRSVKCGHVASKTITEAWHIASEEGVMYALAREVHKRNAKPKPDPEPAEKVA